MIAMASPRDCVAVMARATSASSAASVGTRAVAGDTAAAISTTAQSRRKAKRGNERFGGVLVMVVSREVQYT